MARGNPRRTGEQMSYSVAISRPLPPRVFVTCAETYLSDRQQLSLERFIKRYIKSKRRQRVFRLAVMSRLGPGKPGEGAVEIAISQAALEIGVAHDRIRKFGLNIDTRAPGTPGLRKNAAAILEDDE
jgi:hypothetical protein